MIGQQDIVTMSRDMAESIRFRATVVPFLALAAGGALGYLYARPYIETVNDLKVLVDRLTPLLGVKR